MLMSVKCSAVTSVGVTLTYDDNFTRSEVISVGDIISVEFNKNGMRRRSEGKVIFISASGNDPKNWYIIIDRSEDFDSDQVRFCPQNILDLHIIKHGVTIKSVKTTNDRFSCPYLRIVKGKLQYSIDGIHWKAVLVDPSDIEIRDENGTELDEDEHERPHRRHHSHQSNCNCNCGNNSGSGSGTTTDPDDDGDEDTITDETNSGSEVDNSLPNIIIDNSL